MRHAHHLTMVLALLLLAPASRGAQTPPTTQPAQVLTSAINRLLTLVEPPAGASPRTFSAQLAVTRAEGLPQMVKAASLDLAWQAPDHLRAVAHVGGESFSIGRDGQELWIQRSSRSFGLVGVPGLPKFLDDPATIDTTALAPVSVPMAARMQLAMFPVLMQARLMPEQTIGGEPCHVLALNMPPGLGELLKVNSAELELAIRKKDDLPARIRFADGRTINVELELRDIALGEPWSAEKWKIQMPAGVAPQRAALSHVTNFLRVLSQMPSNRIPTLGPATGNRSVVATAGQGRLELWDDTRVLFLKGTPQEMGRQHGTLLKKQIRSTVDHMLYGIGVGSSFDKGTWFFGEIERAQKRLKPFMSPRYLAEMDALAEASGISWQEIHLSNYFPELFHCSGFAIMGDATVGGRLYHGRVLDYLKGVGLEQNAVVTVYQPDEGNAWVNIGYAGFIGSVTAMNEKQVAIGEMGGRGEGNWDGKPMAQLVREVMEKANTMEEAVEIMRRGPRTCEYYFVISDGKTKRAIAIEATPDKFVTVAPGQTHPKLQHAVKDAVLISGGDRYEKLVERVKENYGKLDMEGARALMNRPVCMTSNIHSVLFAPETLDFWVANADSKNVASHTRYTHYNLREMLAGAAAAAR